MDWLARGESSVPPSEQWLTDVEAARARSMRFTKRRTEYLLRRYAGKCAVAAALGLPEDPGSLARIGVLNAPTGAPFVRVDGTRIPMDVSLTDRAGWAVCLVGSDLGAVGCDLEIVEARSPGFVRDFLTPAEQDLVGAAAHATGPDGHDAMANLIWSAKESALKVLRTGLRADTRTVEVSVADHRAVCSAGAGAWEPLAVGTVLGRLPGWWRRDGRFLLTVVSGQSAPARAGASAEASPPGTPPPPRRLPGSADLSVAQPVHSWLTHPLAD